MFLLWFEISFFKYNPENKEYLLLFARVSPINEQIGRIISGFTQFISQSLACGKSEQQSI